MKKTTVVRLAWAIPAVLALAVLAYALHAANLVTQRMGEIRWDLPSRIFAASPLLYPGAYLLESDLKAFLSRLGYQETRQREVAPGQWKKRNGRYELGLRPFRDAGGDHPAARIGITVAGPQVVSVIDLDHDLELTTFALEPEPIGDIFGSAREQRTVVRLEQMPATMREGILVMEDRHFYEHHGLSFRGTLRALWANFRGTRIAQGGSTLTQQLMKNLFLSPERTLRRKGKEAIMTLVAELLYSKEEIFEAYINEIYLGQRGATAIHGFGEASRFYFSKDLPYLTLSEQAVLVGLISSPGLHSPYTDIKAAERRREIVLRELFEAKKITEPQYREALLEPIEPRGRTDDGRRAPYFADYIRREIGDRFSSVELGRQGYEIHTTLDPALQVAAVRAVKEGLAELEKRPLKKGAVAGPLQAALVALVPQTGAIKAMIGGREYGETQLNRAVQSRRQPGSIMKPFVAAVALSPLSDGSPPVATPVTILDDRPATFSYSGKDWAPKNYEEKYFGSVTLRTTLEKSLNVATVNLSALVGLERLAEGFARFGFPKPPAVPSIALGSVEVTPLTLARAYSVFPGLGLRSDAHGISVMIDQEGKRLEQRSMVVERVLPPEVAFQMVHLLRGVVDRGTASAIRAWGMMEPLAGKTGTTDEYRDSWFVGFSPSLLAVVWVGHDDGSPTGLSGASGALPIWIRFMKEALRRSPPRQFEAPAKIEWIDVDPIRGCRTRWGETLREAFLRDTEVPKCR